MWLRRPAGSLTAAAVALALISGAAQAQTTAGRGTIAGRVVDESGAPVVNADVSVDRAGQIGAAVIVATDESGRFLAEELPRGGYHVVVSALGYVDSSISPWGQRIYRTGDDVTLRLARGGVVTGRVTAPDGEPIVEIAVLAYRVRDESGRDVASSHPYTVTTDDRGIYRIYGMLAGSYTVCATALSEYGSPNHLLVGSGQVYHPSSTRGNAVEVPVRLGSEATGVDITFRRVEGHAIRGAVKGLPESAGAWISARDAATGSTMHGVWVGGGSKPDFVVEGVADGEYELVARSGTQLTPLESETRRVVVRGADATGVDLSLEPLASIAGRIVWEEPVAAECPKAAKRPAREVVVGFRRDDPKQPTRPVHGAPDETGAFFAAGMRAGAHYTLADLADDRWFLASVEREREKGKRTDASAGIRLERGERVTGVVVTFRTGAASLSGRVSGRDGAPPRALHTLVLLPAEPEAAGDLVRYYGATVEADGAFTVKHVAPGRYWILLRPEGVDWFAPEQVARSVADSKRRAALLTAAREAQNVVELKPCQRILDHVVPLVRAATK